ncbi:putative Exopolyphosphatase [Rhodotorula toruloides ATCC 204091]|uniref:Putative Exopolyphosphatase n=1 Tax=Rhodotorula toruloides TaxID=5286 RepID=A0A0K3CG82_RHOTO|nr:putative Exopolyphosphatase [Rhodotorula toruloides ATCC 204091]KAK4335200.1 Exopolyphosphatase [Rhodotorula toruloides]PRQ74543.1 putative Exopolyphosphatase [Rhodotorula toruloides]
MANGQGGPIAQLLKSKKEAFLSAVSGGKGVKEWVISVGNEAGDLDSMACAIGYAHFAAESASSNRQYVPLVLTARSDLHLRPENVLALSSAGISNDSILTIDELPSSRLSNLAAQFALVDHNVLLSMFRSDPSNVENEEDDKRVVSIIDHHADEGRHLDASPRLISPVGSCSSLVTSHFASSPNFSVPTPLADLLLSAIMIDTRLKPTSEGGKATETDVSAVNTLLPFSSFSASTSTTNLSTTSTSSSVLDALKAHNARLSSAKEDVSHLSGYDLLRRDYKEYAESTFRYGLSTVPLPLSTWLEKFSGSGEKKVEGLLEDTRRWMDERKLDLAGILTSYTHVKKSGQLGKHRRELLVLSRDERLNQVVFPGLERDKVLQLEEWKDYKDYGVQEGGKDGEKWKVWQQGNDKATRKQVAPALKALVLEAGGQAA